MKKIDLIEAALGDNENEAARAITEIQKQKEQKIEKEKDKTLEDLKKTYSFEGYKEYLGKLLLGCLQSLDWDKDFFYGVKISDKGLAVVIRFSPLGEKPRWWAKGIYLSNDPKYDFNAIQVLALQADNTINEVRSKGGIITK